jgi:hypothetical protein
LKGDEFDSLLDFSFGGSVMAFLQGRGRAKAFNNYLAKRQVSRPTDRMMTQYLDSHDVKGWLFQVGGDKSLLKLAAVLQMTVIGIPNIYYGDEVGRLGGDWPDNRSDMLWDAQQDKDLLAHYSKLCHIRRAHQSLSRGKHEGLAVDGDIYVFRRSLDDGSDKVVVAINRAQQDGEGHRRFARIGEARRIGRRLRCRGRRWQGRAEVAGARVRHLRGTIGPSGGWFVPSERQWRRVPIPRSRRPPRDAWMCPNPSEKAAGLGLHEGQTEQPLVA